MKYVIAILITGYLLVLTQCTTQRKVEYNIPDNYEGETRKNLIRMLDEGQKLYKINCSRCHGIFTKGKDSIPNFSKTQIENYRTAVIMDDPKNHAVAQRIRPEDLDLILQFLTFRKQSAPAK
jgi:Cytochrome c553